jgi:8-oxo-dGTP diphosphatase
VSATGAVHVVVGLIDDAVGRWLVNARRPGTHMAGRWEFPGGEAEPGEGALAALRRELHEEIGVRVLDAEPLLELVHDYPDKRVRLDVWRVLRYAGEVHSREGQELRWVTVAELEALPLLEADGPIVAALRAQQSASKKRTS